MIQYRHDQALHELTQAVTLAVSEGVSKQTILAAVTAALIDNGDRTW